MNGKDIFKGDVIMFPENKNPVKISQDTISATTHKILQNLSRITPEQREENILLVNSWQESLINQENIIIPHSAHENSRKLVAYFRGSQVSTIDREKIIKIMEFLQNYVEGGYSALFDEFAVTYRFPEKEFLPQFEQNSYFVSGETFRAISSVFGDSIHFSDGRPVHIAGSLPILADTPHKRNGLRTPHIHLPIEFHNFSSTEGRGKILTQAEEKQKQQMLHPSRFFPILETVLHTVQKVEQTLLMQAQSFHDS